MCSEFLNKAFKFSRDLQQDIKSSHRKPINRGTKSNLQLQTHQPEISAPLEMTVVGPTTTNVPNTVSVGHKQLEHGSHSVLNAVCRSVELGNTSVLQAGAQSAQHATYLIGHYSDGSVSDHSAGPQRPVNGWTQTQTLS